jgi:hypothetical protein
MSIDGQFHGSIGAGNKLAIPYMTHPTRNTKGKGKASLRSFSFRNLYLVALLFQRRLGTG